MKLNEITPEEEILTEGILSTVWKIVKTALVAVAVILLTRTILSLFEKDVKDDDNEETDEGKFVAYIALGLTTEDSRRMVSRDNKLLKKYANEIALELMKHTNAIEAYTRLDTKDKSQTIAYIAFLYKDRRGASQLKQKLAQLNKKLEMKWDFLEVRKSK